MYLFCFLLPIFHNFFNLLFCCCFLKKKVRPRNLSCAKGRLQRFAVIYYFSNLTEIARKLHRFLETLIEN